MFWWFRRRRRSHPQFLGRRKLYIPESLYRRMINHCLEEKPLEACGLMTGGGGQVMAAYATDNEERSPIVYKVDDRQLAEVFFDAQAKKQEIIGIYHSHVRTPPIPSKTDIERATWPEAFYVIVSLAGKRPQVRAWRIVDRVVTEHPVVVQRGMTGAWHDLRQVVRGATESARRSDIP